MLKIYFLVLLINTFSISTVVNAGSSLKIIDGDTIILNSEKIRFYGIETVEKTNFKDKYYANENGINSRLDEIQATVLRIKLKNDQVPSTPFGLTNII